MANNNKQAMKAKNSNLYARTINILVALGTILFGTLAYFFAPDILLAIGKFLGILAIVAMVVFTALYALLYEPYAE